VFHEGVGKKEIIEIRLPEKWVYTVEGVESNLVVSPLKYVSLIFEAEIKPGKNDFLLQGQDLTAYKGEFKKYE
jgi:hypothetical protein